MNVIPASLLNHRQGKNLARKDLFGENAKTAAAVPAARQGNPFELVKEFAVGFQPNDLALHPAGGKDQRAWPAAFWTPPLVGE